MLGQKDFHLANSFVKSTVLGTYWSSADGTTMMGCVTRPQIAASFSSGMSDEK